MPQANKAKFELVTAVSGQKPGTIVELEVDETGLPKNRVYKGRSKPVEVATPQKASTAKDS